jgi:hypothetical protein
LSSADNESSSGPPNGHIASSLDVAIAEIR